MTCVVRRCDAAAAMCVCVCSCFIVVAITLGKSSTCIDFSLLAILRLVSLSVMDICITNMTIALVLSLYVSDALISPCMCWNCEFGCLAHLQIMPISLLMKSLIVDSEKDVGRSM